MKSTLDWGLAFLPNLQGTPGRMRVPWTDWQRPRLAPRSSMMGEAQGAETAAIKLPYNLWWQPAERMKSCPRVLANYHMTEEIIPLGRNKQWLKQKQGTAIDNVF